MTDDAKRRNRLLMDYIKLKKARQEREQIHKIQAPYVVVLLDGNYVYVSLCFWSLELALLTHPVQR
jgi:hypothetical protein